MRPSTVNLGYREETWPAFELKRDRAGCPSWTDHKSSLNCNLLSCTIEALLATRVSSSRIFINILLDLLTERSLHFDQDNVAKPRSWQSERNGLLPLTEGPVLMVSILQHSSAHPPLPSLARHVLQVLRLQKSERCASCLGWWL